MTNAHASFLAGLRAEAPILVGVAPFGMIYGALAVTAGLPAVAAQAMSLIVFAGSAQFIAVQLFSVGAPLPVLLLTTLVVNLRHMLYSASLAPRLHHLSRRWKVTLAYLLTDEAYAVAITHYQDHDAAAARFEQAPATPQPAIEAAGAEAIAPDSRHWYFLGAGLALWSCWQLSTAAGIFLGSQAPPSWSLDFTLALTFMALLIPALAERPAQAAALSAGIMGVIGAGWPYKLGLVVAALTGVAVGALLDWRATRRQGELAWPPENEP